MSAYDRVGLAQLLHELRAAGYGGCWGHSGPSQDAPWLGT